MDKKQTSGYELANITEEEEAVLRKAEQEIRNITGKNLVMIAWQEQDGERTGKRNY